MNLKDKKWLIDSVPRVRPGIEVFPSSGQPDIIPPNSQKTYTCFKDNPTPRRIEGIEFIMKKPKKSGLLITSIVIGITEQVCSTFPVGALARMSELHSLNRWFANLTLDTLQTGQDLKITVKNPYDDKALLFAAQWHFVQQA